VYDAGRDSGMGVPEQILSQDPEESRVARILPDLGRVSGRFHGFRAPGCGRTPMAMNDAHRVAIVTGASRGIGAGVVATSRHRMLARRQGGEMIRKGMRERAGSELGGHGWTHVD
jgi:hypothetical protein